MLYQKYKNRGGPKHHGEKEIPQVKFNVYQFLYYTDMIILGQT